ALRVAERVPALRAQRPLDREAPEMRDRFVEPRCAEERDPQVVARVGETGLVGEGALELGDRFAELALVDQGRAEVVACVGVTRVETQRLDQLLLRALAIPQAQV